MADCGVYAWTGLVFGAAFSATLGAGARGAFGVLLIDAGGALAVCVGDWGDAAVDSCGARAATGRDAAACSIGVPGGADDAGELAAPACDAAGIVGACDGSGLGAAGAEEGIAIGGVVAVVVGGEREGAAARAAIAAGACANNWATSFDSGIEDAATGMGGKTIS